jgi:aromatic ring-cleaving dioxygenase
MSRDASAITGFHAHVYYDPETREVAAQVREGLAASFDVRLGRWHDKPVGPHPKAMYQVAFSPLEFSRVVPWLMLNRAGLDILVHAETGDDVTDHTAHAMWLGEKLALDIEALRRN